jgi:hypothetical protein
MNAAAQLDTEPRRAAVPEKAAYVDLVRTTEMRTFRRTDWQREA